VRAKERVAASGWDGGGLKSADGSECESEGCWAGGVCDEGCFGDDSETGVDDDAAVVADAGT
jgi:hypothetical protein